MSKNFLFLAAVVLLAGLGVSARGEALDVNNFSFEYDCDGNQIQRTVPPASGCIMGWTNSGDWFGATMWCGSTLYVSGECQNVGVTDGEVSAWLQGNDIYAYQVTEHVFEAGKRYTITFDAQGWGATFTPSFFYPEDPCFPDVNHIEVGSEAMLIDTEVPIGPNMYELDLEVGFASLPDYDYIGKQIGIKFFNALGGGYVFFDNVRLSWDWATKAYEPNPEDGSDEIDKDVVLEWRPGLWAANVDGHEVYFGTSFAEVNDANSNTAGVYRGPASVGSYADPCDANLTIYTYDPPETLELVKRYYWRVDEVNESYSGSTPPTPPGGRWKGNIWSFEVEGRAKEPYPADEAAGVAIDVVLHWTPGRDAVTHNVYFGTDEAEVNSATTSSAEFMVNQGPNTFDTANYDANGLAYGGEYFWRIDEVGASTVKGHLWSFSVAPYSVVDDFDSYVNTPALLAVWDDYWVNDTGAELTRESLTEFVRDGNSVVYDYDNTIKDQGKWVGSVASADIADLEIGPDWTKSGSRALVLYVLGKAANAVGTNDRMWVEIEDTSNNTGLAIYNGNPNDVTIPEWHEWNIDLAFFDACGVSLADVARIHIGFGDQLRTGQSAKGGTGTVWFDDIGVHPRRCVPAYSKGKGDFEGDCTIDMLDTKNLARDWLESGTWVSATPPDTEPILWFKFDEGSGTTTENSGSLGTGKNGTLIDMFDPWRSPGAPVPDACDPNYCLEFDGTNDYVTSPNMGIVTNELTISAWLKRTADEFIFAGVLIVPGANDFNAMSGMQFGSTPDWKTTNTINYVWESAIETWGWESDLLVPDSQWTFAAVVVEPTQATIWMHDGAEMSSAINFFDHGAITLSRESYMGLNPKRNNKGALVRFYEGQIDDVRVYDYALSQGEVLYLVDHEGSFYQPLEEWRADADGDDTVNLIDYAYMGDNWLKEILWPEP